MRGIILSGLYSIRKSGMVIRIYILFILLMIMVTVLNMNNGIKTLESAEGIIVDNPSLPFLFPLLIIGVIVGAFCGGDFNDKVGNYEVMTGHSRLEIYLGKSVTAVIMSAVLAEFLAFIPLVSGSIIFETGDLVPVKDIVIRQLLFVFPFMRLAAFLAMVTFIVKNQYVTMVAGFLLMNAYTVMSESLSDIKNYIISFFNLNLLTDYSSWSLYNISQNGGIINYTAYSSEVKPGLVAGTIVVSLVVAAIYLVSGYAFYKKDDLS